MKSTKNKKKLSEEKIQMAFSVSATEAEGPGLRYSLWVQGCHLFCPGCCNKELWPENGGKSIAIQSILDDIKESVKKYPKIEGVSFLGGEPYEQHIPLGILAEEIKKLGLSVMVYTGFEKSELEALESPLTKNSDLIVAGRYIQEQRTTSRRWVGSENQEVIFVTDRYKKDDPIFQEKNHTEIIYNSNGELVVVGFPFDSILKEFKKSKDHFNV